MLEPSDFDSIPSITSPRVKLDNKSLQILNRAASLVTEQVKKVHFAVYLRTLRRWQIEFPLTLKCEELTRQLKERANLLESIRSCYLKDVISIKYYLDQLKKVRDSEDGTIQGNLEEWQKSAYDLHVIPSAEIRNLITQAQSTLENHSNHMIENLVDIGVIDPELRRTLNPWEQSRGYRRIQRLRKGPSHSFPDGGECLPLVSPYAMKVFIHPCEECVGIVAVVRSWNQEVEKCMKFYAEHGTIDTKITEYKRVIKSLQSIVEEKEMEIMEFVRKNSLLENASQWFEKWSHSKVYLAQESIHKERITMYKCLVGMAEQDKESKLWNDKLRSGDEINVYKDQLRDWEEKMQRINKERDVETTLRLQLNNTIQGLYTDKNSMQSTIDMYSMQQQKDQHNISELQSTVEQLTKLNETLSKSLELKDSEYAEYQVKMTSENEDLARQVNSLNDEYAGKVDECDRLREEVRSKTKLTTKYTNTINRLHEEVDQLKKALNTKRVLRRFRTAVHCVVFLNKFAHGLRSKDYKSLGYIGAKYLARLFETRSGVLEEKYTNLQSNFDKVNLQYSALEHTYQQVRFDKKSLEERYRNLQIEVENLKKVIESKEKSIRDYLAINEQLQRMVDNYSHLISELEQSHSTGIRTQNKVNKFVLHRAAYLYKSQRNIIHHLTNILFKVRCIIYNIDPLQGMSYVNKEQLSINTIYDSYLSLVNLSPTKDQVGSASIIAPNNSLSSQVGTSFTAELSHPFLAGRSANTIQSQRRQHCVNILRSKTQRLMTYIISHKPHNILHYTPLMQEKWLKWITEVESYSNDENPNHYGKCSKKEKDKKAPRGTSQEEVNKLALNREIALAMHYDYLSMSYIQTHIVHDIYNIQNYVHSYKRAYNEAKEKITAIHLKEVEERKKRPTDRSIISHSSSSKPKRNKVMQIKQSFAHMLDNDLPGYLNNVLAAIESVQQSHGEMYYESDNKGKAQSLTGGNGQNIKNGDVNSSKKTNEQPSNAPVEIGAGAGGKPAGRKRPSMKAQRSQWNLAHVPMAVREEEEHGVASIEANNEPPMDIIQSRDYQESHLPSHELNISNTTTTEDEVAREFGCRPTQIVNAQPATLKNVNSIVSAADAATKPQRRKSDAHLITKQPSATEPMLVGTVAGLPDHSIIQENAAPIPNEYREEQTSSAPMSLVKMKRQTTAKKITTTHTNEDTALSLVYVTDVTAQQSFPKEDHFTTPASAVEIPIVGSSIFTDITSDSSIPLYTANDTRNVDQISKVAANTSRNIDSSDLKPSSRPSTPNQISSSFLMPSHSPSALPPDEEDELDEQDHLDVGDEEGDLQVLQKEIMLIMKRDKEQHEKTQILERQLDLAKEQGQIFATELRRLQERVKTLWADNSSLKEEIQKVLSNYDEAKHENGLLREIIHDSYRYQSKEIESILSKMKYNMDQKINKYEKRLNEKIIIQTKEQSTQIACSVCTIREYHIPQPIPSLPSTAVQVHEVLSNALGVNVLYPSGPSQSADEYLPILPEKAVQGSTVPTSSHVHASYLEKVMSTVYSNLNSSDSQIQASQYASPHVSQHPGPLPSNLASSHLQLSQSHSTLGEVPHVLITPISTRQEKVAEKPYEYTKQPQHAISPVQEDNTQTKVLFDYAKSLLKSNRPHSAVNSSTRTVAIPRPKSSTTREQTNHGLADKAAILIREDYVDSHNNTYAKIVHEDSKFRKLKQMPRSQSADLHNAQQADKYSEKYRNMLRRSDVNTAALLQDTQYINPMGNKSLRDSFETEKKRRVMSASALPTAKSSAAKDDFMQYSKSMKIFHRQIPGTFHPNDNNADDGLLLSDDDSQSLR